MVQEVFAALASVRSDRHADHPKYEKAGCLAIPLFFYGLASVASEKIGERQEPRSFHSWLELEDREMRIDLKQRSLCGACALPCMIPPQRLDLRGEWT